MQERGRGLLEQNMQQDSQNLIDERLSQEKKYWLQKLSGVLSPASLPYDARRVDSIDGERRRLERSVDGETTESIFQLCGNNESLVYTACVTALAICLHKYTGSDDIVLGTAIHEGYIERTTFNRILLLRTQIDGTKTVKQLLGETKQTISEAYAHQKFPYNRILELLQFPVAGSRSPLFNVAVFFEGVNDPTHLDSIHCDLSVVLSICDRSVSYTLDYDSRLFHSNTIELLTEHYQTVLRAIVRFPDASISSISLLSPEKRDDFLNGFNDTKKEYPRDKTIVQLFEEQVEKTPANTAVECNGTTLTYKELNARSNQLARYLEKKGLQANAYAGIFMDRSIDMLVGLLGILKAGAAYVPLDPSHPHERLSFVLEDANLPVVVTQRRLVDALPASNATAICIDSESEMIDRELKSNRPSLNKDSDVAYVIYTSGSTGKPKGASISHRALTNYIYWANDVYIRNDRLDFAFYSSLAFDLTVTSIFTPLIAGNRIVVYPQNKDDSPITEILSDGRTGVLKLTPSHLSLIQGRNNRESSVKRLIVGGEALETNLARRITESFGGDVEIYNEYGPTETTVGCMIHRFDPGRDGRDFVPIGKPAANVQIYLLDHNLEPVAENTIGEIYISGDGVANGYLNRPELTAEKFIANPFIANRRMYRSGDLARRLPNGAIEFIGRRDGQVKFHGHRIELNEIRCLLNQHPDIVDSVVSVATDETGVDIMVAYYVSEREVESFELRSFLSRGLLNEIVPNLFVRVDSIPLTHNGKIDYRSLPCLDEIKKSLQKSFVPPKTPTEEIVAGIWASLLNVEKVGIQDDFFDLGGHSLLATQLVSRIRETFRVDLPVRVLFEKPTVAEFTQALVEKEPRPGTFEKLSLILKQVEGMSEEQMKEMMQKKKSRGVAT